MSFKIGIVIGALALMTAASESAKVSGVPRSTPANVNQQPSIEFVTVEQLKTKLAAAKPVTIIDVRGTDDFNSSPAKIKGAVRVKLRKLRYRLGFPPLKEVPHDQEVVVYCACPNDEASILAVQILSAANFKRPLVLKGGWQAWLNAKGAVESKAKGL